MKVPSLNKLAAQCVNTPDAMLAQLAADHERRGREAQKYAHLFRQLLKQRRKAKRRGVAVAL